MAGLDFILVGIVREGFSEETRLKLDIDINLERKKRNLSTVVPAKGSVPWK